MKKLYPLLALLLLIACKNDPETLPDLEIKKVLILGNSITHHLPAPEIGWHGNWGMAASKEQNSYVSILSDSLRREFPELEVSVKIMVDFERGFWEYDFANMADLDGLDPDILVWRLAENIPSKDFNQFDLEGPMEKVVGLIKANKPNMRVIITNSFWGPKEVNDQLARIAAKNSWELVDLSHLGFDNKYRAIGEFEDEGVGIHPGDKGMLEIANLIWAQVKAK